jgi:hypothetical protein
MDGRTNTSRHSTVGRPRRLSDADIEAILIWHATRRTARRVAEQYGISTSLLRQICQSGGHHYKSLPPELRAARTDSPPSPAR